MSKIQLVLALILVFYLNPAMAKIEASQYTQTRIVEIHSTDSSQRTAIMSGYRYSFTGLLGYDLPVIKMLRSNHGSYQMLNIGMKVKVEYRLSRHARVVVNLEQVPYASKLGIP